MGSILKIIVDKSCQIYCDQEFKGNAQPNIMFRLELRKGVYLIEFKDNETILLSQDYEMKTNDEEDLLKVSLFDSDNIDKKEQEYKRIASLNVGFYADFDGLWLENQDTKEKRLITYNIPEYSGFDKCGLQYVNLGGEAFWDYDDGVISTVYAPYTHYCAYKGGKFGCINKLGDVQIPIIYDSPIYFYGPKITIAKINEKTYFIDKWNQIKFENIYEEIPDDTPFIDNTCIVANKNGEMGIIDDEGKVIIPLVYKKIERVGGYFIFHINDHNTSTVSIKSIENVTNNEGETRSTHEINTLLNQGLFQEAFLQAKKEMEKSLGFLHYWLIENYDMYDKHKDNDPEVDDTAGVWFDGFVNSSTANLFPSMNNLIKVITGIIKNMDSVDPSCYYDAELEEIRDTIDELLPDEDE